jgi:hypothetical protein
MPLKSDLFKGDSKLEACSLYDSAHITAGMAGEQVGKIQTALGMLIPDREIEKRELDEKRYGESTMAAVLDYKTRHKPKIINFSYQTKPDGIVGKMTIMAMDNELGRRIGPIDPSDIFIPPAREQMPGFDIRASDGTIIDLPVRVGRPYDWLDLRGDPADVFIHTHSSGQKLYSVVIQHNTDFPGPARTIAPPIVAGIARAAAKAPVNGLGLPKAGGFVLKWAVGKFAGGLVSLVASFLVPSPIGKEFVWNAKTGDGNLIRYTVVVVGNK